MIKLITIDDIRTLIQTVGVNNFFNTLIESLRHDFKNWNTFIKNPRLATHFTEGVIELMPICGKDYYAYKYVNGHPKNPLQNKQTVVAVGMLADTATGYPLLISEMTLLTAFRTAATSALAASYLAKPESKSLGIIGTGAQSEFLILAHACSHKINKVKYFDIDDNAMKKFSNNLSNYPFILEMCDSAEAVTKDTDILITATAAKMQTHIIKDTWAQNGMHISGIGGDCPHKTELDPAILQRSKVVVEYFEQSKLEGEIQNLGNPTVYAELWEIVTGLKKGRESENETTLFDSVGFALEDYSILKLIYQYAQQFKLGNDVELIPNLPNPKDLYSLLGLL